MSGKTFGKKHDFRHPLLLPSPFPHHPLPSHLCHLANDSSVAVLLPCIIYPELQRGEHGGKLEQLSKVLHTVQAGGKAEREDCYSEAESKEKECTAKAVGRGKNIPQGT